MLGQVNIPFDRLLSQPIQYPPGQPPYAPHQVQPMCGKGLHLIPFIASDLASYVSKRASNSPLHAHVFNTLSQNGWCNQDFADMCALAYYYMAIGQTNGLLSSDDNQAVMTTIAKIGEYMSVKTLQNHPQLRNMIPPDALQKAMSMQQEIAGIDQQVQRYLMQSQQHYPNTYGQPQAQYQPQYQTQYGSSNQSSYQGASPASLYQQANGFQTANGFQSASATSPSGYASQYQPPVPSQPTVVPQPVHTWPKALRPVARNWKFQIYPAANTYPVHYSSTNITREEMMDRNQHRLKPYSPVQNSICDAEVITGKPKVYSVFEPVIYDKESEVITKLTPIDQLKFVTGAPLYSLDDAVSVARCALLAEKSANISVVENSIPKSFSCRYDPTEIINAMSLAQSCSELHDAFDSAQKLAREVDGDDKRLDTLRLLDQLDLYLTRQFNLYIKAQLGTSMSIDSFLTDYHDLLKAISKKGDHYAIRTLTSEPSCDWVKEVMPGFEIEEIDIEHSEGDNTISPVYKLTIRVPVIVAAIALDNSDLCVDFEDSYTPNVVPSQTLAGLYQFIKDLSFQKGYQRCYITTQDGWVYRVACTVSEQWDNPVATMWRVHT